MGVYEDLGTRPVINAYGTVTMLGGSLMPPQVIAAMAKAGESFVDLHDLQKRVGERIAELTQNEAAYICGGAAAGLTIATAACIAGTDPAKIDSLPDSDGLKNEVVVHRSQRNSYDIAVRAAGAKLIDIGYAHRTEPWELEAAIGEKTAAVLYFAGARYAPGARPLEEVVETARRHSVPVIVDAAAQIPPASNLWRFTQMGADMAVFSGGKGLRGPQSTGLILGRPELIQACALNGNPNHSVGRAMKVSKEDMVGIVAAVELYLTQDHESIAQTWEEVVRSLVDEFSERPGVAARRMFPGLSGEPVPRARIEFDSTALGIDRDGVIDDLRNGEPAIAVAPDEDTDAILVCPQTMQEGEERVVARRLNEVLDQAGK